MYICLDVSARYSCQILMKLELSRQIFRQNNQTQNFMKILPVGAKLFRADRHMHDVADTRSFAVFRTRLKNVMVSRPLKKIAVFYGTKIIITVFRKSYQWVFFWTITVQSRPHHMFITF